MQSINCVKIIAIYFGDRRFEPRTAADCLPMAKEIWEHEKTIDPGVDMDTVFVCNMPRKSDVVSNRDNVQKCMDFLESIDKQKTKRGECRILKRTNRGISYGAYNHGFKELENDYTHFFFTEDDNYMIKDDYYRIALEQFDDDNKLGFIGVHVYRTIAMGGIGFTTRKVLQEIISVHGRLAYAKRYTRINATGYGIQKQRGESRFTASIADLGYKVGMINMKECSMSWREKRLYPRC
jgi:hypothetical protein